MCEEAISQAHQEQQLGLPAGKLTSYTDEELMARQLVFLDAWVKPLFKAAAILYPGVKQRLNHLRECREACKAITIKNSNARQHGFRKTPWPGAASPWKAEPGSSENLSDPRDSAARESEQESRTSKEDASFVRDDEIERSSVLDEHRQESRFTEGDSFFLPALGKRSTYVSQFPARQVTA